MWTLVRKDLILDRRTVGLNLALYLIMGPAFIAVLSEAPVKAVAVWAGLVGAMIPLSLVSREDKFRSASLTCSLPVTRDTVVASRFVGAWGLAVGGALAVLAACFATTLAGLGHPVGGWGGAPLAAFVTIGIFLAGLLPFTLRFGFAGLVGFLLLTQALGIVAFLGAVFIGGHEALRQVIAGFGTAVRALQGSFGPPAWDLVLVAAVVGLNVASFSLSRWIYRRREF